ncbi:MAG: glutathione S-transferase [Myxococcales bacterium]|nr:glutathione S-transferase [Myxococcales bacterium]
MSELLLLPYSPWSEKARWALDFAGFEYTASPFTPMLGELPLRLRLRRLGSNASVPVLFTEGRAIGDSWNIAEFAARHGRGAALFPDGSREEVRAWNANSEALLATARSRLLRQTLGDREFLREAVPGPLRVLGPVADMLAAQGARFVMNKYEPAGFSIEGAERQLRTLYRTLQRALDGREHLVGDAFTYADIAMAVTLQFVTPVADEYLPLGPATRRAWSDPDLATEFADLVQWRDRIYAAYRR